MDWQTLYEYIHDESAIDRCGHTSCLANELAEIGQGFISNVDDYCADKINSDAAVSNALSLYAQLIECVFTNLQKADITPDIIQSILRNVTEFAAREN